jgi:hypothetical protein
MSKQQCHTNVPNPGSDEAIKIGCTCPVLDNGHGKGSMYGEGMFWMNKNCPVHGSDQNGSV